MAVYFQNVQNINITGRLTKSEFQYTLQSTDTQQLYEIAPKMRDKIAQIENQTDAENRRTDDAYQRLRGVNVKLPSPWLIPGSSSSVKVRTRAIS